MGDPQSIQHPVNPELLWIDLSSCRYNFSNTGTADGMYIFRKYHEYQYNFETIGIPVLSPAQTFYLTRAAWQKSTMPLSADMPMSLIVPDGEEMERYIAEVFDAAGLVRESAEARAMAEKIEAGLLATGEEMDMLIRALAGGYIPAGESGMPDTNGLGFFPPGGT